MRLALDTNSYRALQEGNQALIDELARAEVVGLPIVVMGELRFGFSLGSRLSENERVLERFVSQDSVRVLPISVDTTSIFGRIAAQLRRSGYALSQNDIWIAATCEQHGYTLATRDRDFRNVLGLSVYSL